VEEAVYQLTEHGKKLKEALQVQISEGGIRLGKEHYGRSDYKWGDEYLEYAVLGRESRTRGRQRRGGDAQEIESIIEKEDGAREREYEYKRRDRAVGNLIQLQQHNILKQTVLESAWFKWEVDKSVLVSRMTPISVVSSKLFLTTYTICQLIYCTNWEKVITAQFEYLPNNVREDL
jgi:hypothetical protein